MRECGDPTGTAGALTDLETELKTEKFRVKSGFTRIENKVLFLIDQPEKPGYRGIQEACNKLDNAMVSAMDVMTRLSEFFGKYKEKQLNNKVMLEMEKLDDEYSITYAAPQQYIHEQKEQSSETSEILTIDLLGQMDISDQSETYRKGGYNVSQEVGTVDSDIYVCIFVPFKSSENETNDTTDNQKDTTGNGAQPQQLLDKNMSLPNEQSQELHRPVVRKKQHERCGNTV